MNPPPRLGSRLAELLAGATDADVAALKAEIEDAERRLGLMKAALCLVEFSARRTAEQTPSGGASGSVGGSVGGSIDQTAPRTDAVTPRELLRDMADREEGRRYQRTDYVPRRDIVALRRLSFARLLAEKGPMPAHAMEQATRCPQGGGRYALVDHPWFKQRHDRMWEITDDGRQAVAEASTETNGHA